MQFTRRTAIVGDCDTSMCLCGRKEFQFEGFISPVYGFIGSLKGILKCEERRLGIVVNSGRLKKIRTDERLKSIDSLVRGIGPLVHSYIKSKN